MDFAGCFSMQSIKSPFRLARCFLFCYLVSVILPRESGLVEGSDSQTSPWKVHITGLSTVYYPRAAVVNDTVYAFGDEFLGGFDSRYQFLSYAFKLVDANELRWELIDGISNAPAAPSEYCMTSNDSHIFMFGGSYRNAKSNDVHMLDIQAKSWLKVEIKSSVSPSPRNKPFCALDRGSLIVHGGLSSLLGVLDTWRFNINSGIWTKLDDGSNFSTTLPVVGLYNGKLYFYGGCVFRVECETTMKILDLDTKTFSVNEVSKAGSAFFRSSTLGVVQRGRLYIFSGSVNVQSDLTGDIMAVNLDNLEIERRKQSMLDSKTTLPILRPMQSSQHFPVSLGDKILLISGGLPVSPQNPATLQAPSNEVWVFNPQNWSWMNSSVWLQPFPRALSSIALKDSNSLLVFGGVIFRPSFLDINDLWEYNRATQKWKRLWIESQDGANSSPKPTQRASMGYFDGSVYVIGGGNVGSILQYTAHRFVIESKTWSLLKISYNHEYSAAYRYGIATLSVGGRLYLIGGQRNAALPFNNTEYDNYVLDMTKSSLEILEASNRVMNRLMASVFAYEDRICIFGGIKNNAWSRTTECLNTTTKVWEELFGGEQSSSNVQLLTTTFMGQVIEFGGYDISTDKLQSDIYLYDAISGGMNQKPKLAFYPPPIYAHSAIAYKTSLYIFGGIGYYSFMNPHVFELDTRNIFCSGFTTISVSLGRIQPVTDGSGDNGYLLSTNCIFSITGANRIWVNEIDVLTGEVTLELRKSALLQQIALDSEGGILWNSNEQMGLDNQFHQKTLAFYQEEANITFLSVDEGITKAGFNFVISFCPFGWMFDGTSCYCPVEHFINIQGSCLKCPFVFNGVSTSMNQTTCFVREIPNNGFEMMEESDYPPPAEGPCIGSVNGKIFLTGGKRFSEAKIDNRFIYNNMESIYKLSHPVSADWIRLRASGEIPTRREFGCFIGHEGSLLLIGGITEKLDHAVYEINPNELVWRKKNYSLDVLTPTCGSYLSSVYVYGTNSAQEKIFFRISSRGELSQLASECPDCPTSGRMPGGVIGSSFYLLSVHKIQNGGVVCHRFDLESSAWSSFLVSKAEFRQETSYSPITNAGYATFNDTIHVFGGLDSNSNPTRQYLVFFPAPRKFVSIAAEAYKEFSGTLRTPPPLHGVSGVSFENSVFFYGGVTGSNGLITSEAWSFDPDKLVWQQSSAAMYPSQRSHFAVATVGNVVYLYSGKTKSFPSVPFGELWEYDLVKKYWSLHICNQAKCPPPLEGSIMTLFGDKLLLIGGRSESTKNIANYWSLSTDGKQSRVWIDRFDSNIRGSHPFGRYGHSFCQNSSHLYIWGGRDLDESEASYDAIFLIGADSSLSRTRVFNSMPVTRMYFTMSLHNNSLYIFGGMRLSGSFLSDLWRYDLNLNSWQLLTPQGSVPSLSGAMSFVQPEYWLILGGEMTAGQEEQGNAWMYQFESNSWIPLIIETNELPLLPAYGGAWWTDNNIHIFGGVFETLELNKIMEYTPEICRESPTEIVGTGTFSTFHDGSGPGKYMTNMTCRWRLLDATRLIVHANMAQGDTLVVREYKDSLDSGKVLYLHEGNAIDSISPSLLSSTGFAVTFVSARKATRLSGNGFTVFYQVCRGEVSFDSIEGCECASGFYHDTERSACTKCETSSDGRTCHTENSPHKFIVIISSAAGVFVVIMMAVFFLYRRRSKRRMDQTKKKNLISIKYSELTITSLLGSGGFGEVYLAEWRGSEVAVKKLIKQDISEQDLQAFYHEMDTMVQLRHPNILLYMAACLEKSKLCIVCEFMQQGTLYDALHNPEIEMDFQRRIDFIKSIATGMQFLHAAEPPILHRDLKTPNLLIDGKFTIKISDFGLAAVKAQGMNGLGSLMWLAPEVINDGNYEAPADVFSFGIITWEILMRKNLYEHLESPLAVAVYVCRGVRPNIPPDMPQDLKDIVVQSWDNKPEKRPTFAKILETVKLIANDKSEAMSSYFSLKASKLVPKATEKDVAILAIFVTGLDEYYADIPDIFSEVFKGYHAKLSQLLSRFQVVTLGSGDTDYIAFSDSNSVIDFCTQFQTDLMNGNWPAEFMEYNQQRNQTTSYAGLLLQFGASYGTVHKDRQESERAVFFGKEMKLSGRLAAQAAPGTIYASGAFKDSIEESTNDGHMWERATPFGLGIPINTKVFSLIIFDFEKKFPIQNPASKIIYSYHYASPAEILLMEGDDVTLGDQSSNPASHQSYPVASPSTLPNQIDAQSSPISNSLREEPALNPKHADAAHSKGVSTKSQLQPLTMARSNIRNVSSRASLGTSAKLLWEINFDELVLEQESIGDGSYGTVYPAIYKGRTVAVKKLRLTGDESIREISFMTEVSVLKRIRHENIIKFIGACTVSPNLAIVMDYVDLGNLRQLLQRKTQQITEQLRLSFAGQIARGMAYLHSLTPPVLHRDLKSANVLISQDLKAFICDFGFARIKAVNQTMTKCGTAAYQAPEVLDGKRYDEKADVYSYAIILWELLTRRVPYKDIDQLAIVFDVLRGNRLDMPRISSTLVTVMQQCWDHDPQQRPTFASLTSIDEDNQ